MTRQSAKKVRVWLAGFCFLLLAIPCAGLRADILPPEASEAMERQLESLNIGGIVIDLNTRIAIPDNAGAGIEGVDLFATVLRHDDAARRPTIVVATPYRREIMTILYLPLLKHGYNLLGFDVRGSGSSNGSWVSFGPPEHYDVAHVIDRFIPDQPWSDGNVGMIGPSYMAISQVLAAGRIQTDAGGNPVHLKALFPLVSMSDCYRDIVMHGGNVDLEFIPMWLGMVDILGALPPLLFAGGSLGDIEEALSMWEDHLANIPVTLGWILDGDNINKNDFYDTKSPLIYWPDKPAGGWVFSDEYPPGLGSTSIPASLPVFLTGGWFDIFTRGTCNNYQYGLKYHDKTDKAMMIGHWYHLDGALGLGVNGLMNTEIPARWFNWKIKGEPDPFMEKYPVLLYVMGAERWRAETGWPLPADRVKKQTLYLSKRKAAAILGDWFSITNAADNYRLVSATAEQDYYDRFLFWRIPKADPVLAHDPLSLHGWISRSSTRWLMGLPALVSQASKALLKINVDPLMPWEDERIDEVNALTFTTDRLASDVEIAGPLTLTFWARTDFTQPLAQWQMDRVLATIQDQFNLDNNMIVELIEKKDVQWVVELNDVFPDGRARNITSGWLSAENRPYDPDNPGLLDDAYEAFDPFYDHAYKNPAPIEENRVYKYVVELWPTDNVFKAGHRIRVSISASDFPHLFPVCRPSSNTIVLDENHRASLSFTAVTGSGDYRWVDDVDAYMASHAN
ncbi:MAG: CocE/NonD family hydrolase [Thermodesulfobacteriota bacterium]